MKTLWSYMRPHRRMMLLALILKFLASVAELLIPLLLTHLIDNVVPTNSLKAVFFFGGVMVFCALFAMGANVLSNRLSAIAAGRTTLALRHALFVKTLSLSAAQTDAYTCPTLISRLTSDTYHINRFMAMIQRMGVRAPILLLGGVLITVWLDYAMALVLLALFPLIALVIVLVSRRGIRLYRIQQERLDDMTRVIQENATGVRVIRALSKTEDEVDRFEDVTDRLAKQSRRAGLVMGITSPTNTLLLNLGLSAVILVGALRLNSGAAAPGVILAFLNYFTMILTAMMAVTRIFIMSSRGLASARRVAEILAAERDLPTLLPAQATAEGDEVPPLLEFRDVSFSYLKRKPSLSHISFSLKAGQTLGIIGGTGSGKSSLLRLLLRLYDPDEGVILLDGQDIRSIPDHELRSSFGVVFQNDFIPALSLRDNVAFFREADRESMQLAAETAQAAAFIAEKPNGWEEMASIRGANLSGGQRQRLLIARALAGNPRILLLDDASSALDYRTDMLFRRALRENYKNTTVITVAQRVSSVRHADLILVLQNGALSGAGTHEELLASCDEYRLIYQTQMGGDEHEKD